LPFRNFTRANFEAEESGLAHDLCQVYWFAKTRVVARLVGVCIVGVCNPLTLVTTLSCVPT
jgi:hypothetical protein